MTAITYDTELEAPTGAHVHLDGGMMFWAGLSYGGASFLQYLVLSGRIELPNPGLVGLVWPIASAVFVLMGLVFKVGSDPVALRTAPVRRFRAIWTSLILGAFVVVTALMIMAGKFGLGVNAPFLVSPVAMCVYGIGWRLAAVMSGQKALNLLSIGAFGCVVALALLAGTPQQSLLYAIGLTVFAIIPGLWLLMRRPA